ILTCLSESEFETLGPRLERVRLARSALLSEPGSPIEYAYFPINCVLSTIIVLQNGVSVEVATAGNEGMVHVGLTVDQHTSTYRIIPQISGDCLRIGASAFREALDEV